METETSLSLTLIDQQYTPALRFPSIRNSRKSIMKNKALYYVLVGVFGVSGCGSDHNEAGTPPPNNPPVVNPPPVEQPPAEDPPNETPSAEQPLTEEPPVEQPPVEEPPAEGPDPEVPAIAALTLDPEIAAKGALPNGNIVLISDRPLDATTVETSLELRDASTTETLAASINYNAEEQRIVIKPARKLSDNKHYAVYANGARDTQGNAVAMAGQSVVKVRRRIYSRTTVYDQDGAITNVSIFMPLPGTNEARSTSYRDPGADGNWFETADNTIGSYSLFQYLPDGIEIKKVYRGPGEGGIWFDDNDEFERAYLTRRNLDGRQTQAMHSTDAGDDDELFTHDDNFVSAGFWVYDEEGKLLLNFYASGSQTDSTLNPGEDNTWLTGDDAIHSYYRRTYDDNGRLTHNYRITDEGDDGDWFSPDDLTSGIDEYQYTEDGELFRELMISDAVDGEWLNGNDKLYGAHEYLRIDGARVRKFIRANSLGQIDAPGSFLDQYDHDEFDEQGRPLAWGTFVHQGADQNWHTVDDIPSDLGGGIYRYELNENGIPEEHSIFLLDNGENGRRFDGDELVTFYYIRSYDETSQLARIRYYQPVNGPAEINENNFWLSFETEYLEIEE